MTCYCLHLHPSEDEPVSAGLLDCFYAVIPHESVYRMSGRNNSSHHWALSPPLCCPLPPPIGLLFIPKLNKWQWIFFMPKLYFSSCHYFINQEPGLWKNVLFWRLQSILWEWVRVFERERECMCVCVCVLLICACGRFPLRNAALSSGIACLLL